MQAVIEITKWDMESQPNHIYLLDGDKILAYIPNGNTKPTYLNRPMRIDQRGRKFTQLKINPFTAQVKSTLIEVRGSKGDTYFVDPEKGSCSCPAHKFRGTCKHVKDLV
jgi:hypothetical protein